jgi:type IV fimbrial biogenesis protein FimT
VTRNQQVTVCPSDNGTACVDGAVWSDGWIAFPDTDQDRDVSGDEQVLVAGPGVERLTINTAEFDDFIVFRPGGRVMVNDVDENSGQFTFCDYRGAEEARVVIIETSGHPRLSDHQADGDDPDCPDAV